MRAYEVRTLVTITGLEDYIIVECVQREVVHARTAEAGRLLMEEQDVARLRRVRRLMSDFGIGLDAVVLILELQDEIARLRGGTAESGGI
jgi:hypothetical protein